MKHECTLWVGNFGTYLIPKHFRDVRMTKTGWPDLRFKRSMEFFEWVAKVDKL